jgi:hypothetical protein
VKSKRQVIRAKRQRKEQLTKLGLSGIALVAIALLGYAFLSGSRPAPTEEEVAVMPDTRHVVEGTDPGPFNSDPPTSGRHYANTLEPGFYDEGEIQAPFPEGYLGHNLEHGYIIFWYNCALVDEQGCTRLKEQIQTVISDENNFKVIGFPWDSTDMPVVATSWGRIHRFEEFDPRLARDFVQANRNKAPEPNAP